VRAIVNVGKWVTPTGAVGTTGAGAEAWAARNVALPMRVSFSAAGNCVCNVRHQLAMSYSSEHPLKGIDSGEIETAD
jgi:hypothetical protein